MNWVDKHTESYLNLPDPVLDTVSVHSVSCKSPTILWAQMPLYYYTQLSLSLSVSWLSKPNPTVQLLDEMAPPSILFIAQWSDGTENWIRWIEFLKKIHKIRILITSWRVMNLWNISVVKWWTSSITIMSLNMKKKLKNWTWYNHLHKRFSLVKIHKLT